MLNYREWTSEGFKPQIRGLLQLMKAMEELTIESAVTGDRGTPLQAFTMSPLIWHVAKQMLEELLVVHEKYLPQLKR